MTDLDTATQATGTAGSRPPRHSLGDVVRAGLRGVGQTLITVGVVLLLFCVYELKVTNIVADREQTVLSDELRDRWAEAPRQATQPSRPGRPASTPIGDGFAVIYVPRFGKDWKPRIVVEGVSVADLKKGGPGHIPSTALPGEVGNVVLSGHRTTYGAPFNRADELQPGDPIVVETRTGWFTYTVRGLSIVKPTAVEVTLPVPGKPGATPTQHLLTLTTCNPKYSATERLIVHAELTAASSALAGPPAALREA